MQHDEEISVFSAQKEFKILLKRKIWYKKNCYLLTDLVVEMANLYEIYCVKRKVDDNKKKWNLFFNKSSKTIYSLHQFMEYTEI